MHLLSRILSFCLVTSPFSNRVHLIQHLRDPLLFQLRWPLNLPCRVQVFAARVHLTHRLRIPPDSPGLQDSNRPPPLEISEFYLPHLPFIRYRVHLKHLSVFRFYLPPLNVTITTTTSQSSRRPVLPYSPRETYVGPSTRMSGFRDNLTARVHLSPDLRSHLAPHLRPSHPDMVGHGWQLQLVILSAKSNMTNSSTCSIFSTLFYPRV